jgi:hypothetical protein
MGRWAHVPKGSRPATRLRASPAAQSQWLECAAKLTFASARALRGQTPQVEFDVESEHEVDHSSKAPLKSDKAKPDQNGVLQMNTTRLKSAVRLPALGANVPVENIRLRLRPLC